MRSNENDEERGDGEGVVGLVGGFENGLVKWTLDVSWRVEKHGKPGTKARFPSFKGSQQASERKSRVTRAWGMSIGVSRT